MRVAGLCIFGVASLAAAYSPSPVALIGARALLAVGTATMMPATLSIIRLTFTDEKECALAIGAWSAIASGGSAIGPLIGGVLLEYFWWGSVFPINIPVVVLALAAALALIPADAGGNETSWDLPGSLLILIGLVGLAYAIEGIAQVASLAAAAAAAVIGAGALALFAWRQRRQAAPLIDFTVFRDCGFTIAVLTALASAFCIIGVALVLSQRLQLVLGLSPLQEALFMLPSSAMAFVGGPLAGWLSPRYGADRVLAAALAIGGCGSAGLFFTAHAGAAPQLVSLAAFGPGVGAAIAGSSHAIMSHASPDRAGMAAPSQWRFCSRWPSWDGGRARPNGRHRFPKAAARGCRPAFPARRKARSTARRRSRGRQCGAGGREPRTCGRPTSSWRVRSADARADRGAGR